jgi:hypothetical protein
MITAPTAGPAVSTAANLTDYRYRPTVTERTILPDSTPKADRGAAPSEDGRFPERNGDTEPKPVDKDSSAMFAAAVISGALRPTPQTMEELMVRIGTSTIPEESEARLKDLLA